MKIMSSEKKTPKKRPSRRQFMAGSAALGRILEEKLGVSKERPEEFG